MTGPVSTGPVPTGPVSTRMQGDIAVVTIDNPPVNATSQAVRAGLLRAVEATDADPGVRAVVLACAGRTFVAGADIREFGQPPQAPLLPDVVQAIEAARKPWVAALHGTALGGGLELALGCVARVAASGTSLGFPEVNLGLIPGAGGTVRLPRVVPVARAVEMIAGGKPVSAAEAAEIGLVDAVTEDDDPLEAAIALARGLGPLVAVSRRPVIDPPDAESAERLVAGWAAKAKGWRAPVVAAETVLGGALLPPGAAIRAERETFATLRESEQSAALRHVFAAERSVSKSPGAAPRPHQKIGVIGGGTMGAGIAATMLLAGRDVTLVERDAAALAQGRERIAAILDTSRTRGLIGADRRAELDDRLALSTDTGELAGADLAIEAVFEDMEVKRAVFAELDDALPAQAVLATNTSYLDVGALAAGTRDPSRVVGMHFFSPAHVMKLVEVVRTDSVAPDVLATAMALAKAAGKVAVPAGVCDGFIGNRIMSAYRLACECMIEDGAFPSRVDRAMRDYGFPMGVFEMQDLAGLDIGWAMRKRRAATRDPAERYVDIPDRICELGRFGRKTGAGYYRYPDNRTPEPDPLIEDLIRDASAAKGIKRRDIPDDEIIATILEVMQREGAALLAEGVADSAAAIDVVMVLGYGFPRWRGGPMFAARQHDPAA